MQSMYGRQGLPQFIPQVSGPPEVYRTNSVQQTQFEMEPGTFMNEQLNLHKVNS